MFHLFRRHQKVLLTTIATVAIGSMAFSAIAPIFMDQNPQSANAKDLNKNLNETIVSLFNHSFDGSEDKLIFPEAIFSSALLDTGLLERAAFSMKDTVAPCLDATFLKIMQHEPQQVLQGMSHYELVSKISPKLFDLLIKMKKSSGESFETKLDLLVQFFKEKQKVPAFMLHQYIQAMSKGQSQLSVEDLEWFGLKNPEDFFGKELINAAVISLVKSLKDDVKSQDGFKVIQKYQAKLSSFYGTNVHPNQYFIAINIDPKVGLEALKTIEALKSLKNSFAESLLLDSATHAAFYDFATKKMPVNVYRLKKEMEPKSLEDAIFCDLYASLKQSLSFDQYDLKIRSVDKSKAFAKIPKKQILSEALNGYSELSSLMPYALSQHLVSDKDRLDAIKNLSGSSKTLFDNHMQKAVLKNNPQFFQKALNELAPQSRSLFLTKDSKFCPLEGFASIEQLKTELDMLPLNTPVIFDLGSEFMHEIELVSKSQDTGLMSFNQALESGVLKDKLKRSMEGTYKELVKKSSHKFLNQDKKLKTLDEAYLEVLEVHAKDLKKKMAQSLNLSEEMPSKLLIKGYSKLILQELRKSKTLDADFRIEKSAIELARHETQETSCIQLFENLLESFSDVILNEDGSYVLYEKTGDIVPGEPVLKKEALDSLAAEKLKHELFKRL
jgi:hypothetical protein